MLQFSPSKRMLRKSAATRNFSQPKPTAMSICCNKRFNKAKPHSLLPRLLQMERSPFTKLFANASQERSLCLPCSTIKQQFFLFVRSFAALPQPFSLSLFLSCFSTSTVHTTTHRKFACQRLGFSLHSLFRSFSATSSSLCSLALLPCVCRGSSYSITFHPRALLLLYSSRWRAISRLLIRSVKRESGINLWSRLVLRDSQVMGSVKSK